jgi:hypothetical protein
VIYPNDDLRATSNESPLLDEKRHVVRIRSISFSIYDRSYIKRDPGEDGSVLATSGRAWSTVTSTVIHTLVAGGVADRNAQCSAFSS